MSPVRERKLVYVLGTLLVVLVAVGVLAIGASRATETKTQTEALKAASGQGLRAVVVPAMLGSGERRLSLQGDARPWATVTLYAKVSGYLRSIHVDRGDKVRAGQILAEIESPELNQQYLAANADAEYKRANAQRTAALAAPGAVSLREAELDRASAAVAAANVAGVAAQRGYTLLRAPFAGTVTARFADPGALVQNATNAQSGALPVLAVSQLQKLRVFVYVDQRDAPFVKVGTPVVVSAPGLAEPIHDKVARVSGELDSRSRMMVVQVDLDNKDGRIVAGSYLTVSLVLTSAPLVEVPAEALVVKGQSPFVVVVLSDHRAELRPVVVLDLDGTKAMLGSGLKPGELVALNVGRSVESGDIIAPVAAAALATKTSTEAPRKTQEATDAPRAK